MQQEPQDRVALSDARNRALINDGDTVGNAWKEHYDQNYRPFDPQRPMKVPTLALSMQVATELDLLLVAVRNVLRAQSRRPEQLKTFMADEDLLELLRNVAEHWDETGGRSTAALAVDHPDVQIGGIAFTNKEIWIGGKVPLSRIRAWLYRVRNALVLALESEGEAVLDDMASLVEGDDALSWPPDRHRYRYWSLPVIDEADWPTEEIPPEVAHLEGERFRQIRKRNVAD